MVSKPPNKRGRPANYVKGRDGKPIIGLSRNKADGRYYATHSKPRKWFSTDYDRSLIEFRAWEARQEGRTVEIVATRRPTTEEMGALVERLSGDPEPVAVGPGGFYIYEPLPRWWWEAADRALRGETEGLDYQIVEKHRIPEDAFWAVVREAILANPTRAGEKTGLPLDRLHQFKPLPPSPTLESLGKLYQERAKVTDEWRKKAAQFWGEFVKAVRVKTVRDLTAERISDYCDAVLESGFSPTYVRHRFGTVKRILNFAQTRGVGSQDAAAALTLCKVLVPPKANGVNPHPISRDDFHSLLAKADEKWRAILLCCLNFCMYAKEVADLELSELNLATNTLVTRREKTGITRVAVIWQRTVEAIKRLPAHADPHLFVSIYGTGYDAEGLRTGFRKLRREAGLSADVKISDIRDGSYTAAVEAGADLTHAKILAGHAVGIPDHYLRRNPKMVADACEAIARHYFGEQESIGHKGGQGERRTT